MRKKLKQTSIIFFSSIFFLLAFSRPAEAAIFVDNSESASTCENGASNYDPVDRVCGDGGDTVYTSLYRAGYDAPSGASGDHIIIEVRQGTYNEWMRITQNYITYRKYPSDVGDAILDGNYTLPNAHTGMINVGSSSIAAHDVIVEGFRIIRTGPRPSTLGNGSGIIVDNSYNVIIRNNYFYDMDDGAILTYGINGPTHHITIEDNYIERTGMNVSWSDPANWGGAISLYRTDDSIVRRNKIIRAKGEAINCTINNSNNNLVEYNEIVDCQRIGVFLNGGANAIVRYNLIYHTMSDPEFSCAQYGCYGISIIQEYLENTGHLIYGNLVAGGHKALNFSHDFNQGTWYASNIKIFNNTFIEAYAVGEGATWQLVYIDPLAIETGIEIKNNIFWQTDGTIADVPGGGQVEFDYNLWSKNPDNDAEGPNDPGRIGVDNYPMLNVADYLQKSSGWTSLTPGNLSADDFKLLSSAQYAIDRGMGLGAPYDTDIFGTIRPQGVGWDVGGHEYVEGNPVAPGAPEGLAVR